MLTNPLFLKIALTALLGGLLCADAFAGPGGIIKGKWSLILALLAIPFLPFIMAYMIRRHRLVKQTKGDLATLAAQFPQYHWLDAKDRVTAAFTWMWSAWSRDKLELAKDFATEWYWRNQELLLDEWRERGVENICELYHIDSIAPLFVEHRNDTPNGEGSRLVVAISAQVYDYMIVRQTGKVIKGDKKLGNLETIWTFIWQGGQWRLNLIEPSHQEMEYLKMPNILPVPSALRSEQA